MVKIPNKNPEKELSKVRWKGTKLGEEERE